MGIIWLPWQYHLHSTFPYGPQVCELFHMKSVCMGVEWNGRSLQALTHTVHTHTRTYTYIHMHIHTRSLTLILTWAQSSHSCYLWSISPMLTDLITMHYPSLKSKRRRHRKAVRQPHWHYTLIAHGGKCNVLIWCANEMARKGQIYGDLLLKHIIWGH